MLQVEHGAAGLGDDAFAALFGFALGGAQFDDPRLLHGQFALLVEARLFLFQPGVLGDEVALQQALVVGGQLLGDGQGLAQRFDGGLGGADFRGALVDHRLCLVDAAAQFQVLTP
ncbi:hypothetical protein D9M71_492330 [compost metagenome]